MKRRWQACLVVSSMLIGGVAQAQAQAQGKAPEQKPAAKAEGKGPEAKAPEAKGPPSAAEIAAMFPKPGPETKALQPFIGLLKLKGTTPAGAMGPGSPAQESKGTHSCKWSVGGLWLDCDVKNGDAAGKHPQWNGHVHMGWDYLNKDYRAVIVDNMGGAMMMEGKMDGQKLVLESVGNYQMMGKPTKMRMTFDLTDPKVLKVTEERQEAGKWMVVHESTGTKGGK